MYLSVKQTAQKWNISERSVRNYCSNGKIKGAFVTGKTWNIPENATKPIRQNVKKIIKKTLLNFLKEESKTNQSGGIYHKVQVDLTYNSNRIEGSKLTHDETRYIFETNTIGIENKIHNVDDIIETSNHFKCVKLIIEYVNKPLTEKLIKQLHYTLKNSTSDSRKSWFNVGEYKKMPNEVGGCETTNPENVSSELNKLITNYNAIKNITFDDIISFHYDFEKIHPFQDGNGRVGRLLMFKECLKNNIVPFIIDEEHKLYYYRGLKEFKREAGYLRDTCLSCQDKFKTYLDYFKIPY